MLLADQFAIAVYAYAVMDNHVHLVVQTDPQAPQRWEAREVLRRWIAVSRRTFESPAAFALWMDSVVNDVLRVAEYRLRLGSLSWFMRLLNEPIARQANAEDGCTGRFWEGRFRCQALLDESAVLSAMTYVDLNPVRAGIVAVPEEADFVSIRRRCNEAKRNAQTDPALLPIAGTGADRLVSRAEYLALVKATAQMFRENEAGSIDQTLLPILRGLAHSEQAWFYQVRGTRSCYWRVIGRAEALVDKAAELGQRWMKGLRFARRLRAV